MKKVLFLFSLFAISFAVLGGIGKLGTELADEPISGDGRPTAYIAKYRDCIDLDDFPKNPVLEITVTDLTSHDSSELGSEIKKYRKGLEEAVKNLNHIEAHHHIHREFQGSLSKLGQVGLSQQQRIYYLETMRLCFESDKALNLQKVGNL